METHKSEFTGKLPSPDRWAAVELTGISATTLKLAQLFENGQWNSFARMQNMTPEMQADGLKFLASLAKPMDVFAGALALTTLTVLVDTVASKNEKYRNFKDNVKKAPQAMVGYLAQRIKQRAEKVK